jgi:HD-GYP domain-containing protein (c-di-GMP phosphodiesterase class II)
MNSSKIFLPEEKEQIKKHVRLSFDLVFPHNSLIATIILAHHQFHPKDPYPNKQIKDRSLLFKEQKLLALCDLVDALISPRSYKKSWAPEDVAEHLLSFEYFSKTEIEKAIKLNSKYQ